MRTRSLFLVLALALIATPAMAAAAEPDHATHEHRLVRILSRSLHPEVHKIDSSAAIGWLNYSDSIAKISFDAEVAKKMVCRSPNGFRVTGDRLESPQIRASQFATVCSLEKGEYAYRVELVAGQGAGPAAPPRIIAGTLIVE